MSTTQPLEAQALADALPNAKSSVVSIPASESVMTQAARQVDCRWLLALYAVIPVSLAVVAIDTLFLEQAGLNSHLPSYPEQWAFWAVVFGLPGRTCVWMDLCLDTHD